MALLDDDDDVDDDEAGDDDGDNKYANQFGRNMNCENYYKTTTTR